jgi:glycyl-tRNA synthetase
LGNHQKFSGKKIQYFDPDTNESYVPYVVETSIGVDRTVLLVLSAAYAEETITKENGETDERVVLRIPPILAPVKFAVLPLVKKDGLPEKAKEIMNMLKFEYNSQYDEKDTIGKRYRRQDAIGTPFCITIDNQTLDDDTVTIRYRDTMAQERVSVASLSSVLDKLVNMKYTLQNLELKTNKYQ